MKPFFTLLFILIIGSVINLAATTDSKHKSAGAISSNADDVNLWGPAKDRKFILSAGYSADFKYEGYLGLKATLDCMLRRNFSAGIEAGIHSGNLSFDWMRTVFTGLRGSYHLVTFGRTRSANPWSVYGGLSTGALFGAGGKVIDEVDPYIDIHAGARYLITNRWMIISELSSRSATIGLSFRF